ncbi:MAG: tetratricopeptide repeat protein [Bacteroidetes bacterium]|nr:MAG: tetratricopeptide repeat protein [Bacteroidota bacterium]
MKLKQNTKKKSPLHSFPPSRSAMAERGTRGKQQPNSVDKKRRLILGLIIAATGFLLYSNTLSHGYVLDDFSAIKENNIVRQGISAIPEIFKTSYRQGYLSVKDGLYRPLSLATYAIEWNYFPDRPGVSHLVNVVLYGITGIMLFFMLSSIFISPLTSPLREKGTFVPGEAIAFITSLLFIVHPLHVEVVANIKSRDEIMCFLFVICSFLFVFRFLESGSKKFLVLGAISYFLSLLSKETSITFLALLPLALHFFSSAAFKKNISITAFFLVTAVMYLAIRHSVLQGAMADDGVSVADNIIVGAKTFGERIGTAFYILGLYLKMLALPHPMSYDYSFNHIPVVGMENIVSILSLLFYVIIGGFATYVLFDSFKKNPPRPLLKGEMQPILGFGIFFFLVTIFLFSNLVLTIGTSMGDRLMYFPSLGFCICMAVLFCPHPKRSIDIRSFPLQGRGILLLVVVVFFVFKTYTRNADWKDNYTLYSHDVQIVPNSVKAHYYLGLELVKTVADAEQDPEKKKNIYEKGIQELKRAVEIMPAFSSAFTQMGVAYYRLKNYEKAIENYNKASALKPSDAITLNNIGSVYFEWGKYAEATEKFGDALRIDPRFVDAHMNLGSVCGTLKDYGKAIVSFQNAIKYAPDNAMAYYFIAITYQNMGDKVNADKYFQIAGTMDQKLKPH